MKTFLLAGTILAGVVAAAHAEIDVCMTGATARCNDGWTAANRAAGEALIADEPANHQTNSMARALEIYAPRF